MSELGDVLELLYGARTRFRSVRLEAEEHRNYRLQRQAYERAQREQSVTTYAQLTGDGDLPEEGEATLRLWFEQPNRFREERVESGREMLHLGDGLRWWVSSPEWATVVQEGNGWEQEASIARTLLDPAGLIPATELEVRGRSQVAGRNGIALHATPRGPHPHPPLAWGASTHELVVDAERGVLLRVASSLDSVVFETVSVTTIAFDEPLDARLFRYEAAEGEEVLRPEDVSPGATMAIEEAAKRASFTVLVPASLGPGWRTHALYVAGRARIPETVHISLFREEGTNNVSIRETAPPFERWQLNRTEERQQEGTTLHVSGDEWPRVLVERHGTCAELNSQTYTTDELVALALTLVPAAHERPPLLG